MSAERLGPSILAGLRYIRHGPIVRRILLRAAVFGVPASALWALLPVTAARHWHLGAAGYGLVLGLLGVGAVAGVAMIARLRAMSSDNTLLAGSAALYAVGLLAAAYLPFGAAAPWLLLSGVAWIATLTTLNASAQLSLAPWVRARGLSMYLLTFMGSQAVGSVLWGALASHLGLAQSLTAAAALLAATAASVAVLPLLPDTGRLDRTTSTAWPTPPLVFEPEPADGPVLIWTSYRVAAQRFDEFRRAMMHVRGSRLRTGGYGWRLYRSGDEPDVVVEQFTVPSWGEFYRQHTTRWLGSDHAAVAAAMALTRNGRAEQHWFLAVAG